MVNLMASHKWDPVCRPPRGLVRPVPLDPTGREGPTRGQARGPGWRRTSQGFYVPSGVDGSVPEQRILEQSMRLPTVGAVTGWAACRLYGGNHFDGLADDGATPLPVPLAVGPGTTIRRDAQVAVTFDRLPAVDVIIRQGIRVVRPDRAVFDAMRFAPDLYAAVAALDMALAVPLTSVQRILTWTKAHRGSTNIAQAVAASALAREHVRSGRESTLRLVCEREAGLPGLEVNRTVRTLAGRFLGVADLLDLEAGLVIEFDGAEHRRIKRHNRDLAKDEALRGVGLEVCRVSGTDLLDHGLVVDRVRAARARARFDDPSRRRWVADPLPDSAEQTLREREVVAEVHAQLMGASRTA